MNLPQAQITFLFNDEGATLDIRDLVSGTTFVKAVLNRKQVLQMLSRQAHVETASMGVFGLDKLGMKQEVSSMQFEMPECDYGIQETVAKGLADKLTPEGWVNDGYFRSQDSFFNLEGKSMAKVTIRRWVDIEEAEKDEEAD